MRLTRIYKEKTGADKIYNMVVDKCEFFKDQNHEVYAVTQTNGGYDLRYLSDRDNMYQFFRLLYFRRFNKTAQSADMKNACETIAALTASSTDVKPVYNRIGQDKNTLYYDLCNSKKQIVEISQSGAKIITSANVTDMFFRTDNCMYNQVTPNLNSSYSLMDFLSDFFQIDENQKLLFAVYVMTAFIPNIKHPLLIVEGEKGAGKTTLLEKIWQIVNPVNKGVFAMPNKVSDLVALLSGNYFVPIDNVGKISDEFSNIFCQASTGGSMTKRKLYTDNSEVNINIKRIVAFNGIDLGFLQSDLLDRAILINLNRIVESKRLPMEIIDEKFEKYLPDIMGSVFNVLSKALKTKPNIHLKEYERMADFYQYGYAIAEAMQTGYGDRFIKEYNQNIKFASRKTIEKNPLLESICVLMDKTNHWKGSATELLVKLQEICVKNNIAGFLPDTANSLSRELKKHTHELTTSGIFINYGRSKERYIEVKKLSTSTDDIDGFDDKC